jgi:tetratricopeptide (TPR) repeat protein
MKDEPLTRAKQPKHLQEHAPTVIHDPLADETLLARWFRQNLEKGPRFWLAVAGTVVGVVAVWLVIAGLTSGRSADAGAWESLMLAKDTDDRVKVGQSASGLPASWALLQAAEARYQEGFADLPANRDAALPLLSNAYELFKQAADKAPADSTPKRLATLGMARCLEARGDLDGAIQQYQTVAKSWPETDEGKQAAKLAERLKRPEAVAFYQQFSTYKPPEMTLPPRGTSTFDVPGLPALPPNHPDPNGPTIPAPGLGGLGGLPGSATLPEPAPPTTQPAGGAAPATPESTPAPAPAPPAGAGAPAPQP